MHNVYELAGMELRNLSRFFESQSEVFQQPMGLFKKTGLNMLSLNENLSSQLKSLMTDLCKTNNLTDMLP